MFGQVFLSCLVVLYYPVSCYESSFQVYYVKPGVELDFTFLKRKGHTVDRAMNWGVWVEAEEGRIEVAVTLTSVYSFEKYLLYARYCSTHWGATGEQDRHPLQPWCLCSIWGDRQSINELMIKTDSDSDWCYEENKTGCCNRVREVLTKKDCLERWHVSRGLNDTGELRCLNVGEECPSKAL